MDQLFVTTGTCTAGNTGTLGYVGPHITTTPFYDYSTAPTVIAGLSVPSTINKDSLEVASETKTHFVFKHVMPGVRPEDLSAFVRSGNLIIDLDPEKEYLFEDILSKTISIDIDDEEYNQEDIELNLTDGVLTILVAKATPDKQLTVK